MTAILALLFKIVGVGFLFVAAIGVIRFSDAFQRMHAATKAGTLGAGLVILGAILSHGATSATIIGLLTIVFLLMAHARPRLLYLGRRHDGAARRERA
jgi:monovalent cation/proton antiporter MnhG/PhaG subunit